jgi:hypothetical protein
MNLKEQLILNAKNLMGWKTNRKIVVFSVDDYGNVRLDSKSAREGMDRKGITAKNRFDRLDTLETKQDLEMLYDVLLSVKDKHGHPAVFTPFALPCNIDFEGMRKNGYDEYRYELLPVTYKKLSERQPQAYDGAWDLWLQGIELGLIKPQFHGREHLNLKVFEEKLKEKNKELITNLENRSFTSLSDTGYETISSLAAFDFWEFFENERFHDVISDGLNRFEEVYGYQPDHFTPPAYNSHPVLNNTLSKNGVKFIDSALLKSEHQGEGKFKKRFNYTGKTIEGLSVIVRNVVFEPTEERSLDWVDFAVKQIEAAFRWNKPAIISSHRVNYCGHIDPGNREKGLKKLENLLIKIVEKWPDAEFMSLDSLGKLIKKQ